MSRSSGIVAIAVAFLATACERALPPAMTVADAAAQAAPAASRVVFVRPTDPCDGSDYSIVVDGRGRFVGHVAPGTQVVAEVAPGPHVFFSWSSIDLRDDLYPQFNPVSAVRVNASPESTRYVALVVRQRGSTVTRCGRYAETDLVPIRLDDSLSHDLIGSLSSIQLLAADASRGQAMLDSNPARLQSHLELGRAKLVLLDYYRADHRRRAAEKAAEDR
jgi:hypothetical protein